MASASERLLIAKFASDTRDLLKGVQQVEKSIGGIPNAASKASSGVATGFGKIGKALGTTVASATAVATAGLVALGAKAIKAGASYNIMSQKANAAFKTILGSQKAADQMMSSIAAFAKTSPFPRQVFIDATQKMLAFGFAAKDVIPTLGAIQDAVAAAGGSSADLEGIVMTMSKIKSSGKITAQDLMEFGNRGVNAAELIGKAMGKTGPQIKEEISKGSLGADQALSALTKGMGEKFKGAADGVKKTWTGAIDRVNGALRDLGAKIVAPFIDPKGGGYAVEWANKLADLFRAIEAKAGPALESIFKKLKPVLDKVSPIFDRITDAIKGMGGQGAGQIGDLVKAFAPLAAILGGLGASNILGEIGPLAKMLPGIASPLGAVVLGIGTLIAMSPELRSAFKPLIGMFIEFAKIMGPILGQVIKAIMPVLILLVDLLGKFLITALKALMPFIIKMASLFVAMLPSVMSIVKALFPLIPIAGQLVVALAPVLDIIAEIVIAFAPLIAVVAELVTTLLGELMPVFKLLIPVIAYVAKLLGEGMATGAKIVIAIITEIVKWFTWMFNVLVGHSIIPDLVRAIINLFTGLWKKISDLAIKIRDAVVGRVRQLRDWVIEAFNNLRARALSIVDSIRSSIVGKFNALRDSLRTVANSAKDAVIGAFNTIKSKATSIIDGLVKAVKTSWGGLEKAFKAPISFLINTVINKGLIGAFNWVARKVNIAELNGIHIAGFDRGGWTGPGARKQFAGAVHADEFVVQKRSRRRFERSHPGWLDYLNRTGDLPGYAGGGRVSLRGKTFTARFAAAIQNAQKLAKTIFSLFQGGFRPATSYSGTSHAGDAVDLGPISAKIVRALRASGIAAWDRTGMGNWMPHIHGVPLPGFGSPGGSATWQAQSYLHGGNGLGGKDNGAGAGYRPWPITGSQAGFFDLPKWLGKFKSVTSLLKNKITDDFVNHGGWGNSWWDKTISAVPKAIISKAPDALGEMGKSITSAFKEKFSFDRGGWLMPGLSLAVNNTGQPEPILSRDSLAALGSQQQPIIINVQGALDPDAVARQIERLLSDHRSRRGGPTIRSRTRTVVRTA